mmetsp:Transcript_163139/g.523139  ORF Transcript_163139/g.523139 Transcript_163139/m.523139 type:complete len:192 (+) Transcript_163139:104-679(+)
MKRGNVSHVALSSNVAELCNRVSSCELRLGVAPSAPAGEEAKEGPISDRVDALAKEVNELFENDAELTSFENQMGALASWMEVEHSATSHLVLNNIVKRNYVIQRSDRLREIGKHFGEIHAMEEHMRPPVFEELPKHSEQLHNVEVSSAVTVGSAIKLHEHVSRLAEDYHKTVMGLNSQLLVWSRMFDRKP